MGFRRLSAQLTRPKQTVRTKTDGRFARTNEKHVLGQNEPVHDTNLAVHDHRRPVHDRGEPVHDRVQPVHDHQGPVHDHRGPVHDMVGPVLDRREGFLDGKESTVAVQVRLRTVLGSRRASSLLPCPKVHR